LCTEHLIRLPGCFLCYRPPDNAPPVEHPPCEKSGFITFGSFNNLAKVNAEVVVAWARLLHEIPDSRLVLKSPSLNDTAARERYQALFAAEKISGERLELIGFIPNDTGHLGAYSRIDLALDTFPYNGTTTTCEALWMGAPVVSLRGDRHGARVGASLLTAAGFPEWIASTPEEYIDIARKLSQDRPGLTLLRSGLRERIAQSRLCAADEYARVVEAAYAEIYARRRGTTA
jgi:predicted O-linked N-acetylglucosamine transferase (SPINDLY family)